VARAVEWAVRASNPEMRERGRTVIAVPPLPAVAIDETRLKQVLLNLLLNAAKALDPNHRGCNVVRVSAFECGGRVTIEVSDTGCGISPETAARMFEPFFTTRAEGEGTGLGLSVSASIVESVGGSIDAESSVGHGSTFRITLPLASPSTSSMRSTRPTHAKPKRSARVLLVNSDAGLLSAMGKALALDHAVVPVNSGSAALEHIRRGEHFDAVVCDLLLSDLTGLCLRAEVERASPRLAEHFVFLSDGGSGAAELLAASSCPCLQKPICFDELSAIIARYAPT
jgi:CheY-like chemotaxis protein